jgi:hypothetical protein
MAVPQGTKFGGVQVLAGVAASIIGGPLAALALPLFLSGGASMVGAALAHRPVGGKGGFSTSATYGWSRSQNAAFEGAPRFFVLGEEKIAPSYINAFTAQSGTKEIMWCQYFCGTGGANGISLITDIRINDEPIASYSDAISQTRLGTATQTAIPGFDRTSWSYVKDQKIKTTEKWTYKTVQEVEEVVFVMEFKNGLYRIKDDMVRFTSQHFSIKAKGLSTDTDFTRVSPPKAFSEQENKTWLILPNVDRSDDGHWFVNDNSTGVVRYYFRVALNKDVNSKWTSAQKFEFTIKAGEESTSSRVRQGWVTRVEEIVFGNEAYAGSAILGLQIVAQERIAWDYPNVTCTVRGWKVTDPRDNTVKWTRNPALLARAVLLDSTDGMGDWIGSGDLWDGSGEDWRTVATRCDALAATTGDHAQARWELGLCVDSYQDAKDWFDHILGTFRASMVEYGGKIGIVQDVAAAPVATFDARISPSTASTIRPVLARPDGRPDIDFRELDTSDRANIVGGYYRDETDLYLRKKTDEVKDTARLTAGDPEVRKEAFLPGVNRQAQAIREIRYTLNNDRLNRRAGSIGVGIGDLDFLPEDKIVVYADSPKSFTSGATVRVLGISYDNTNSGRIHFREYDAGTYDDTSDTLPTTPLFVSRQTALAQATQAALPALNVTAVEQET